MYYLFENKTAFFKTFLNLIKKPHIKRLLNKKIQHSHYNNENLKIYILTLKLNIQIVKIVKSHKNLKLIAVLVILKYD